MIRRDVVVVGASAGGVEALRTLVSGLPADFPAAVLVVLHMPPGGPSALPSILARAGALPVRQASRDERLRPGEILVATPDQHLIVYDGHVTLSRGPKENGHRPAVDVLFRSAAKALGPRAVAVVLSGALDDGTAGMVAVRSRGGLGVVQDPADALHASMPQCAIAGAAPDYVAAVDDIAPLLVKLVGKDVEAGATAPVTELMAKEAAMADLDGPAIQDPDRPGEPSGFSCPDCNGTLFEIHEGALVRFRCRVGHAWSAESLAAQQSSALEGALWMALRSLEEKAALTRDMGLRAAARGHDRSAQSFATQSEEALEAGALVRELIAELSLPGAHVETGSDDAAAS